MQTPDSPLAAGPATASYRCFLREGPRQGGYPDAECLGDHASQALIEEVQLTPKPGLVDRRGPGAHHDLSLELFAVSAQVLRPYFQSMAEEAQREGVHPRLRAALGRLGRDAELEMLKATNGRNTHQGAIWSLGLLTAGAAMQLSPDAAVVCSAAGQLARSPDAFDYPPQTRKQPPWRTHATFGARSEACNGFPHVLSVGLPVLRRARAASVPENLARVDALLAIISTLPDTCILRRGGVSALSVVQQGAKRVGDLGGSSTPAGSVALQMLERTMLELWVSPGGSADLLAATLFLDQLSSAWMSSAWMSSAGISSAGKIPRD